MGGISDREREQYVKQLTRHCGDGRLTLDELEERVGEVWAATTPAELQHAMRELPRFRPDPAAVGEPVGGRRAAATTRPACPAPPAAARRTGHPSAARGGLVCMGRPPAILLTITIVMLLTAHWIAAAILLAIAVPKLSRVYRFS